MLRILIFFLAAAFVRNILRHFESRWQIVIFCVLAVVVEFQHSRTNGLPFSPLLAIACAGAAATAIVIVKVLTEARF